MIINFISNRSNLKRGSYRIHVHDLNIYLNTIGAKSSINKSGDILIFDKGNRVPSMQKDKLHGLITPNSDNVSLLKKADFVIVGSVEERESIIPHNKNAFIFPQIEKIYLDIKPKIHQEKDETIIGYHGNPNHLNHLTMGLQNALERLFSELKIKLLIIQSQLKPSTDWIQGKPNIPIEYVKWDIKTISQNIKRFDIGVVPTISSFNNGGLKDENSKLGKYNTDIQIRFKNKSNIGRSLVLIQHGIPTVADITPSNMHIFSNPDNGYAVLTEEGWYHALNKLCNYEHRNYISQNAFAEFKRLYDPLKWAKKLYDNIEKVYYEKIR